MAVIQLPEKDRKISLEKRMEGGGIVYCLNRYDNAFSEGLLDQIAELHNDGHCLEDIADTFKREPTEILLGLIHQAEQGKITRPLLRWAK